jgi:ketopantoate reductase
MMISMMVSSSLVQGLRRDGGGLLKLHADGDYRGFAVGAGGASGSERLTRLVETMTQAGIEAQASVQIAVDLWAKFVFIVGLSGATALFRAPIGPIREHDRTAALLRALVEEAVAVGQAEGVPLTADQAEQTMAFLSALPAGMKASMFEDLLAGNRLELPWSYRTRIGHESCGWPRRLSPRGQRVVFVERFGCGGRI